MPSSRRLRTLPRNDEGGAAVENALVLSATAVLLYSLKASTGVAALIKPLQQGMATLLRALT